LSQIQLGISQVGFGIWSSLGYDHPKSKFQFGMSEIGIPIWDIPSLIWDMVKFGQQHFYSAPASTFTPAPAPAAPATDLILILILTPNRYRKLYLDDLDD